MKTSETRRASIRLEGKERDREIVSYLVKGIRRRHSGRKFPKDNIDIAVGEESGSVISWNCVAHTATEGKRCNRLKIARRPDHLSSVGLGWIRDQGMHLIGFHRNSKRAETEARADDLAFGRLYAYTTEQRARKEDVRTKPCVHVSVVTMPPVVLCVCTITVYIIGTGQHVDRERPLLHQTPVIVDGSVHRQFANNSDAGPCI